MPALAILDTIQTSGPTPTLRVWSPESENREPAPTHRVSNPVRPKTRKKTESPGQGHLWDLAPLDPAVAAAAVELSEKFGSPKITEEQRKWLRENLTIRTFYQDWLQADRIKHFKSGRLTSNTLQKDRQVINRWEEYSRPERWPSKVAWPGVPIGMISTPLIDNIFDRMRAKLADTTVKSTAAHLATIIHAGQRLGLIDPVKVPGVSVDRIEPRIFSNAEMSAAYMSLSKCPDMQAAFVLSLSAGPRTVDLFRLKWSDLRLESCPRVKFIAVKTGFMHVIPLGPVVLRHLERLPQTSDHLFPGLVNPASKDPERSEAARERNDKIRSILFNLGVHELDEEGKPVGLVRPWQSGRKTAGTLIERVERGMSSVLLGHGCDDAAPERVTVAHYLPTEMEPSPDFIKAVNAVRFPDCFYVGVGLPVPPSNRD